MAFGLKECLVESATLCIKSEVILTAGLGKRKSVAKRRKNRRLDIFNCVESKRKSSLAAGKKR